MPLFPHLTIKWKLRLILLAFGIFLCIASGGIIIWNEHKSLRNNLQSDLTGLAEVTAINTAAALAFSDGEAAAEVLSALGTIEPVETAAVYDGRGELFSQYRRANADTAASRRIEEAEEGFIGEHLIVKTPILLKEERIGTLMIEAHLRDLRTASIQSAITVIIVMMISLLAAGVFSIKLEKPITLPLTDIAETARQVSENRDYTLRARKSSGDEVGQMVDAFNHMLEQIEARTEALQNHKAQLEKVVEKRTLDLKLANEKLGAELHERIRAEEALQESEKKFRAIFDEASDGILIAGVESKRFYLANAMICRMLGYARDELEGMEVADIHPEEDLPYVMAQFEMQANKEGKVALDIPLKRKNGEIIYTDVTSSPVTIGSTSCLVGIFRDITERKENEQTLIAAKREAEAATMLKNKFLSLISHDLRSPLQGIISFLEILEKPDVYKIDDLKKQEMIEIIRDTVRGSIRMLNRLLDVSKVQTGKMTPSKRYIDLSHMVSKALENIAPAAREKGVLIISELPDGMRIFADPMLLAEVLQNLLSNALKFSGRGGKISLFRPEAGKGLLAVRDAGCGIDRNLIPNLFRYDIKTSTPGTGGEKGAGLGLPLCMDIMKAHGGDIYVESELGKGSTFFLQLPDVKRFIVVADDQEIWRSMLREQLGEITGSDIIEAEDGIEVLEIMEEAEPILIVTDIDMPRMNGLEVLARIKGDKRWKHIPVIVSSALQFMVFPGKDKSDAREAALSLGASAFLQKPADPQKLAEAAAECLRKEQ